MTSVYNIYVPRPVIATKSQHTWLHSGHTPEASEATASWRISLQKKKERKKELLLRNINISVWEIHISMNNTNNIVMKC